MANMVNLSMMTGQGQGQGLNQGPGQGLGQPNNMGGVNMINSMPGAYTPQLMQVQYSTVQYSM